MIARSELDALPPAQRAHVIFTEAKTALTNRLWQAALGKGDRPDPTGAAISDGRGLDLDSLMQALASPAAPAARPAPPPPEPLLPDAFDAPLPPPPARPEPVATSAGLGPNARHAPALTAAAARTGLPPAALAAIVDAEAAKRRDGSWNTHSRNPRSSAAGLGQFLSGTWEGEAERPGTWLNRVAHERGWLDPAGRVTAGARAPLLALRYDATASIEATADYARRNLDRLDAAGVRIGDSAREIARAAYLGHHLGPGDSVRFLSRGGLDAGRARMLLEAQIGANAARERIADAGAPTAAHREWLLGFIDAHVQPERFAAVGA